MRRLLPILTLLLPGCGGPSVSQQPLYGDGGGSAPATSPSLVFGPPAGESAELAARNDGSVGAGTDRSRVYYGPGGRLFYADGSPVQFEGVRRQLQDLRAEERINPVR